MYWRKLFCLSTRDQTRKVTIQHNSSHQRNFITQRSDTHQQTSQVVIIQSGSYFQMFLNFFFQPDWCSDVRSWYAKNSTDCSACVRCRSRVFLGIFVFLPSLIQFTPAVRQNTLNLFSHLFKFCFSWTLLTIWLPTYFCKFVSYCPIKFGKVEWFRLTMSLFSVWKIIFSLSPCLQNRISQY